jgi:two-component system response regulator AtoC
MKKVILIDDDKALCRSIQIQIKQRGYDLSYALSGTDGLALIKELKPHIIFTDLHLPDMSGLDILNRLKEDKVDIPIVMVSGYQDMKAIIDAIHRGALDYIRKPFRINDIIIAIEKTYQKQSAEDIVEIGDIETRGREIVGSSNQITHVVKQIAFLSKSRVTVLIQGESGTGKELVARALHESSSPDKPFIALNCSAVVPTLLESELFGHEKGAFTGADTRKIGKLEVAGEGTIFFDEIGEMSIELQAKLLRVLQEREFERVGGVAPITLRARVISATHRNLDDLIKESKFRRDLYYRLAVSKIKIPSLSERKEDIPLLVRYLMAQISHDFRRTFTGIEKRALKRLEAHTWPGNVRELENVLTQAMALSIDDILTDSVLESVFSVKQRDDVTEEEIRPLRDVEKDYIASALSKTGWNITGTSKLLEISPTTLRKKISDYNLTPIHN